MGHCSTGSGPDPPLQQVRCTDPRPPMQTTAPPDGNRQAMQLPDLPAATVDELGRHIIKLTAELKTAIAQKQLAEGYCRHWAGRLDTLQTHKDLHNRTLQFCEQTMAENLTFKPALDAAAHAVQVASYLRSQAPRHGTYFATSGQAT